MRDDILTSIENIRHTDSGMFFLLAGPCVVESEQLVMTVAEKMCELTDQYKIPYIFKGSYRKANRSRNDSFTGIGDIEAL